MSTLSVRRDRDVPASPEPSLDRRSRIPQIQGLRALAIVLVIAYHAGLPVRGGFVGVDVFFVISGYVITRLIVTGRDVRGRFAFGEFYRRRVRRLLPALALMVSIVLVLSMALESPIETQTNTAISGAGASFWLANAALYYVTSGYFAPNSDHAVLLHTWSLSVEEQFYVVFPWVIAIGYWVAARRRRRAQPGMVPAAVLVLLALAVSLLIDLWLCYGEVPLPAPQAIAFFFPFSRAWEFAAGALVAVAFQRRGALPDGISRSIAAVGLGVVLASSLLISDTTVFPGLAALAPVVGTALLIVGVQSPTGWVSDLMGRVAAVRIGDLSYSLYLWHWPFIAFTVAFLGQSVPAMCVAACVSFVAAWASFRWIEQPFRERSIQRSHTVRLLAICIVVPVGLATALGAGASASWGNDRIENAKHQVTPKLLDGKYCQIATPLPDRDLSHCTYPGTSGARPIILLGDSNAGQYADGLVAAGKQLHRTVIVAVTGGCSLNVVEVYVNGVSGKCARLATKTLEWLKTQPPSVVLIASANEFVDDDSFTLEDPETGDRASTTADKTRLWQRGLERVFESVWSSGHVPVQIRAMPHFRSDGVAWTPAQCTLPQLLWDFGSCGETQSLAAGNAKHAGGLRAEHGAAAAQNVREIDLRPEICPGGTCSTKIGDFWVYREGMHLTTAMSRRLAPTLAAALASE